MSGPIRREKRKVTRDSPFPVLSLEVPPEDLVLTPSVEPLPVIIMVCIFPFGQSNFNIIKQRKDKKWGRQRQKKSV